MSKLTITIEGPVGTGKSAIVMLLARAAAAAAMPVKLPHAELDEAMLSGEDSTDARKYGPSAVEKILKEVAGEGVEMEIKISKTPRVVTSTGFRKEVFEHPMAPVDRPVVKDHASPFTVASPFAEAAPLPFEPAQAALESAEAEQDERFGERVHPGSEFLSYMLMLPDQSVSSGYSNARSEIPPGVIPTDSKSDPIVEKAGGIPLAVAMAGGFAWLAKNSGAGKVLSPPLVQRVAITSVVRVEPVGDPITVKLPEI